MKRAFRVVMAAVGNKGNGTFAPKVDYAVGSKPEWITAADLTGDGKADLAVANFNSSSVSVFVNQGGGAFGQPTNIVLKNKPRAVTAADVTEDGLADLIVANGVFPNGAAHTVSVLFNQGGGSFDPEIEHAVGKGPQMITAADLTGDGRLDLAIPSYTRGTVSLLVNQGGGALAPAVDYAVGQATTSVAAADFGGDGKPDLAVVTRDGQMLTTDYVKVLITSCAP